MKTKTSIDSPIGINKVVRPYEEYDGWVAVTLAPGKKTMGARNYWDRDLAACIALNTALSCLVHDGPDVPNALVAAAKSVSHCLPAEDILYLPWSTWEITD